MPMPVDTWPLEVLTPKHPGWWLFGGVKKGPDSVSQLQQLDNLDGGPLWQARFAEIPVYCQQRILAAQAVQGLASTLGLFRLRRHPAERSPAPGGGSGVPFSDGASFSDGTLFAGVSMAVSMAASGALHSAVVEITVDGGVVQAGMEFSLYDPDARWRMHRILRVLEQSGPVMTVEITPPLRFDVASGQDADFEDPSCTMRMTNAAEFLQLLEWNRWADLTAEFEEAIW
jgi:hypothetical protein